MNDEEYNHYKRCTADLIAECRLQSLEPAAYITAHPERDPVYNWKAAWDVAAMFEQAQLDFLAERSTWAEFLTRLLPLDAISKEMGSSLGQVYQCLGILHFIARLRSSLWLTDFECREIRKVVAEWQEEK